MAEVAVKKVNSAPRGRDRKKLAEGVWTENIEVVAEFDDDYRIVYLSDPKDLATLGKLMGHCSGTHFIWACEEKIWYFFALLKGDTPVGTLHAKMTKWMGKAHPRDGAEPFPTRGGKTCPDCEGYGYDRKLYIHPHYKMVHCKPCNRSGRVASKPGELVLQINASDGGYPSFEDFKAAFKAAGAEYEPGKYAPLSYNSQTYEYGAEGDRGGPARANFDYSYPNPFYNGKPEAITDELWAEFTKNWKAMKDAFNKNTGFVKIAGRTFKFDGKDLIVLSFSDKSHVDAKGSYRKMVAEFLNDHQKAKKPKEEVASG